MKIIKRQTAPEGRLSEAFIVYRITEIGDFSFYEVRFNLPFRYFLDLELYGRIIPLINIGRYDLGKN